MVCETSKSSVRKKCGAPRYYLGRDSHQLRITTRRVPSCSRRTDGVNEKKEKKRKNTHTRKRRRDVDSLGREVLAVAVVATVGGLSVRSLRATRRTQTGRNCHFVARALKCEHTRGHWGTRRLGFHTHHSALQLTGPTVLSLVVSRT